MSGKMAFLKMERIKMMFQGKKVMDNLEPRFRCNFCNKKSDILFRLGLCGKCSEWAEN